MEEAEIEGFQEGLESAALHAGHWFCLLSGAETQWKLHKHNNNLRFGLVHLVCVCVCVSVFSGL